MDAAQKYAYRYLIYQGTLWIRPIAFVGLRWWERWNLLYWLRERKRVRNAGDVANWLHNLALFSATDFEGFDEVAFWAGLEWLRGVHPDERLENFRTTYWCAAFEFREGRWPTLEEQAEMNGIDDKSKKA